MIKTRIVVAVAALALGTVSAASAATPNSGYTGKADLIVAATPYGLHTVSRSATPLTPGTRTGMTSIAGADYESDNCPQNATMCAAQQYQYRAMVFKTSAIADSYWKKACPGCSFRRDVAGGWRYYVSATDRDRSQPISPTNASAMTVVALCGNLFFAAKTRNWGTDARFVRQGIQGSIDQAEAAGTTSCDLLKQEPDAAVFARGVAENRGKAVAAGSIRNPSRIYLRIRTSFAGSKMYVTWTLTCTNGKRTETTNDEGFATIPLTIQLPIGISGATRCTAATSVVSAASSNVDVRGTHSIELRTRP